MPPVATALARELMLRKLPHVPPIVLEARSDEALTGTVDLEAAIAHTPTSYTVKGLFLEPLWSEIRGAPVASKLALAAPPKLGRYLPFGDYPGADYARLIVAAGARRHPSKPLAEAVRRVARDGVATFRESSFGRMVATIQTDPASTIRRFELSFRLVFQGPTVRTEVLGPGHGRVIYDGLYSMPSFTLGAMESLVLLYDLPCRTRVSDDGNGHVTVDLHWQPR